jgi:outer membrane protein assembly factor BamB
MKRRAPFILLVSICAFFCLLLWVYWHVSQNFLPSSDKTFPLRYVWSQNLQIPIVDIVGNEQQTIVFTLTNGYLYAIDPKTGSVLWKEIIIDDVAQKRILPASGKLFILGEKFLFALNEKDGKLLWKKETNTENARLIVASDNEVILNRLSENIEGFSAANGEFLWSYPISRGWIDGYIWDNTVIIPDIGIAGVNITTGKVEWQEGNSVVRVSALEKSVIYYISAGELIAFDALTKRKIWNVNWDYSGATAITTSSEALIVTDEGGKILLINKLTGLTMWEKGVSSPIAPLFLNKKVFILENFNNTFLALDEVSGNKQGALRLGLPKILSFERPIAKVVDNLLIFSKGSVLYAYGEK